MEMMKEQSQEGDILRPSISKTFYLRANYFHLRQTCFYVLHVWCLEHSSQPPLALYSLEEHSHPSWTLIWGLRLVCPSILQVPEPALGLLCLGTDHPGTGPTGIITTERELCNWMNRFYTLHHIINFWFSILQFCWICVKFSVDLCLGLKQP